MAKVNLYNTDSMPVQIDAAGRQLEARGHDRLDDRNPYVDAALKAGLLVRVETPAKPKTTTEPAAGSDTTED